MNPCSALPITPSPSGVITPNAIIGAATIDSITAINHAIVPNVKIIYGSKGT